MTMATQGPHLFFDGQTASGVSAASLSALALQVTRGKASLFISNDGNTAILGGNNDDSANGAAWVFGNIPTSVAGGPTPQMYELMQNYPNPFNPNTVIIYQLPTVNFVSLKVLDVLGREVATLVNEAKQPGTHSVQWNASTFRVECTSIGCRRGRSLTRRRC
jgi:hypothetical protein